MTNAHATAWAHLSLLGFLRPRFGKLLPALIYCRCLRNIEPKPMNSTNVYPEFAFKAEELAKFIAAADFITIMLKNGEIVHFTPINKEDFVQWLTANKIKNLRAED